MAKHTSGPWVVGKSGDHRTAVYKRGRQSPICILALGEMDTSRELPNAAANARLIAAAPDLFDAADRAQCSCTTAERNSGHRMDCWMPDLQIALDKARGVTL